MVRTTACNDWTSILSVLKAKHYELLTKNWLDIEAQSKKQTGTD
jgi:hypothetical protein